MSDNKKDKNNNSDAYTMDSSYTNGAILKFDNLGDDYYYKNSSDNFGYSISMSSGRSKHLEEEKRKNSIDELVAETEELELYNDFDLGSSEGFYDINGSPIDFSNDVSSAASNDAFYKHYPHKCPICKFPAYIGLNDVDCSYEKCENYKKKA